jgi:hypothetical protein
LIGHAAGVRQHFPPEIVVQIKALACELPAKLDLPLSRLSINEVAREAVKQGLVAQISGTTVWRWLSADAIRPWRHRCWIFPRDPQFAEKACVVLDLYQRVWQGKQLKDDEYVLSTDEKTSIQARCALSRVSAAWPWACVSLRTRIRTQGRIGIPGSLGCWTSKAERPL